MRLGPFDGEVISIDDSYDLHKFIVFHAIDRHFGPKLIAVRKNCAAFLLSLMEANEATNIVAHCAPFTVHNKAVMALYPEIFFVGGKPGKVYGRP